MYLFVALEAFNHYELHTLGVYVTFLRFLKQHTYNLVFKRYPVDEVGKLLLISNRIETGLGQSTYPGQMVHFFSRPELTLICYAL